MRLGDMLVAAKIVTQEQVEAALVSQKDSGRRLGGELVALGFVSELQITQMLSNQLSVPWVDLQHVEFSRELLSLIPKEVASEHCCIPIYRRQVRGDGDTLFVAMDDPSNEAALAVLTEVSPLPIRAMVSPPSDIRNAIRVYYFGESPKPVEHRPKRTASRHPGESPALVESEPAPPPEEQAAQEAAASEVAASELPEEKTHPGTPAEPPPPSAAAEKAAPRFVTLTLLDGTTVRLPSPAGKSVAADTPSRAENLTASDLVNALLARGQGAEVGDILGEDANWELLFATLLQLLIRKGLVADWEFVEAWKKARG
jgi:type IV pilus assembly protein PilB